METFDGTSEPVLAIHGISSTRRLWLWLRKEAPSLSLIAPDLRGRGDSVGVEGQSNIRRHVADCIATLDALEIEKTHVCGMSMGGFVGVALAVLHPQRVKTLTLVDGGFPMPTPPGLTKDNVGVLLAARNERLERTWGSLEEYRDFFVPSTSALLDPEDPFLTTYLEHDLKDGQVRLRKDVLADDAADVYFGEQHWQQLRTKTRLIAAQWSGGKDTDPAYSDEKVAEWAPLLDEVRRVEGVDHAASIMSKRGAQEVAEMLHRSMAQ